MELSVEFKGDICELQDLIKDSVNEWVQDNLDFKQIKVNLLLEIDNKETAVSIYRDVEQIKGDKKQCSNFIAFYLKFQIYNKIKLEDIDGKVSLIITGK